MDDDIRQRLEDLEKRVAELERESAELNSSANVSPASPVSKKLSIREFIDNFKPGNNIEKVLAIAYYKEIMQGIKLFTVKDLESGFKEAKEQAPENVNLPILNNVQKGFLMETEIAGSKLKTWELTNSGIKTVNEKISNNQQSTSEKWQPSAEESGSVGNE